MKPNWARSKPFNVPKKMLLLDTSFFNFSTTTPQNRGGRGLQRTTASHSTLSRCCMNRESDYKSQTVILAECPTVRLSDYQTVRLFDCLTVKLSDCQLSYCHTVRLSVCKIFSLSDCQTLRLSYCQTVRLSECQTVRHSDGKTA